MKKVYKYTLLCFYLLLPLISFPQFYFLDEEATKIKAEFLKNRIIAEPDHTFFNLLKIYNESDKQLSVYLNINAPQNWMLIAPPQKKIILEPKDTMLIPVRSAPSPNVKGEIGYTIVASLSDDNDQLITNAYSFVNIPKKSDLRFKILDREVYLDQNSLTANFTVEVDNRGNTDEMIYFDMTTGNLISIPGEVKNRFLRDFVVPYNTDTTIQFKVKLNETDEFQSRNFHRIDVKASSLDTSFKKTVWINDLKNEYERVISPVNRPLIIEVSMNNIFSTVQPTYQVLALGNLQFMNNRNVHYYYRKMQKQGDDLFKNSRTYVEYVTPKFGIKLGDITSGMEQSLFGRGTRISKMIGDHQVEAIATRNIFRPVWNLGSNLRFSIKKSELRLGYAYSNDQTREWISQLGLVGSKFKIKTHNFSWFFAASERAHHQYSNYSDYGYGGQLYYRGKIGDLSMTSNNKIGSQGYTGAWAGRRDLSFFATYPLQEGSTIFLNYRESFRRPSRFINDSLKLGRYIRYERIEAGHILKESKQISIYYGPELTNQKSNTNFYIPENEYFASTSVYTNLSMRYKPRNTENIFRPSLKFGYTWVTNYSSTLNEQIYEGPLNLDPYLTAKLSLTFTTPYWGFYLNYFHGPTSIDQQFSYTYNDYFSKYLRIYPYFERYIYKDIIKFNSRLSYVSAITSKANNYNLTNEFIGEFGKGWSLRFMNSLAFRRTYDLTTQEKESFTSSYFEFVVRKEFGFQQPRLKYFDLKVVYYKDLNGNRVKDDNDPGIQSVLTQISREEFGDDTVITEYEYRGEFIEIELLSDNIGEIAYQNIPEGNYWVKYMPLGSTQGNYTPDNNAVHLVMNEDKTIYIPFLERNKIFGRIVMNRSKLSNLGKIDVSNIKVTATDSEGHTYSTLTDNEGKFIIYTPRADKYIVSIKNIFYENFDLQQNNFLVQLDGYKQFELAFIFNEKRRRIRFSTSYEYDQNLDIPGIEIVRRTNLTGSIKDETTLKPILANIAIVDRITNEEIASTTSNIRTGDYSLSFAAGDDYILEISAEGYWYYSEPIFTEQLTAFQNIKKDVLLKSIEVGKVIPLTKLKFESGKSEIPPEAMPELDRLLKLLRNNPTVRIQIHGHADDLEVLEIDRDIATERAKIVAKYLIANGYSRIKYVGHANKSPVAPNDTEEGRSMNRRVEIVIISK